MRGHQRNPALSNQPISRNKVEAKRHGAGAFLFIASSMRRASRAVSYSIGMATSLSISASNRNVAMRTANVICDRVVATKPSRGKCNFIRRSARGMALVLTRNFAVKHGGFMRAAASALLSCQARRRAAADIVRQPSRLGSFSASRRCRNIFGIAWLAGGGKIARHNRREKWQCNNIIMLLAF